MNVHWISPAGVERHQVEDLKSLLAREDGFVWVDFFECDEQASRVLLEVFGFHPIAVNECRDRMRIPKVHPYADHLFVILHSPDPGTDGYIDLLELDQFIGRRYLVTVHGPLDEDIPLDAALRETQTVLQRIETGRYRPKFPAELSYTIVSAITRRMATLVSAFAGKIAALDRQIMKGHIADPEQVLETMFQLRHGLLTLRTIAAQSREVYARIKALPPRFVPSEERQFTEDLMDQFDRVWNISDREQEFLQGVIDFYQNRTITKLNIAMERLALITVLLLPITAIASIYGMNIIVFERTSLVQLGIVIAMIGIIIAVVFWWTKRQKWW